MSFILFIRNAVWIKTLQSCSHRYRKFKKKLIVQCFVRDFTGIKLFSFDQHSKQIQILSNRRKGYQSWNFEHSRIILIRNFKTLMLQRNSNTHLCRWCYKWWEFRIHVLGDWIGCLKRIMFIRFLGGLDRNKSWRKIKINLFRRFFYYWQSNWFISRSIHKWEIKSLGYFL